MRVWGLVVVACIAWSCSSPPTVPDPGVSIALNNARKEIISNVSYDLRLQIPASKEEPILGQITVDFDWSDDGAPVILDFSAPNAQVSAVRQNGKDIEFQLVNQHLVIGPRGLDEGHPAITINFTAGDMSLNRNDEYLYTLFVPDRASTCFPLFDQPNLKASWSLELETPADWKAMSNGAKLSETSKGERTVHQFEKTKPISSYLFAFATGKFKSASRTVQGRAMTMLYRETDSTKVNKNLDEIFRLHEQSLSWLESYTKIPYPFGKFDFALIPSFQYGGMEHPGSIFYNESSLFLDDNASVNRKMGRASVIAHETAHMWFGDLVTMDWFNDVWMKEVFANFMAAKIVQPSFPEIDHNLRFFLAHYPSAYSVDRTPGANPILQPLDNLKNAGNLYGAIIYQKAPIVMRHLEKMIGEDDMRESLRKYLDKFQYGNAVWNDLVSIIDERSPLDIKGWSDVWINTPGMPEYRLTLAPIGEEDSIGAWIYARTLSQKIDTVSYRSWNQRIKIFEIVESHRFDSIYDLNANDSIVTQAALQFPNEDGFAYGYFPMDEASVRYFFEHYGEWDAPVFRASMLVNAWESMLRGDGPSPLLMFDNLEEALFDEQNPLVTDQVLGQLERVWWLLMTPDQRASRQAEIEQMLWSQMMDAKEKGMKMSYFRTLSSLALTPASLSKLEKVWNGQLKVPELTLSEDDQVALVSELAIKIPARQESLIAQQIENTKNPDRKAKLLFVRPSLSSDEKVRDQFFESLKDERNREHEPWVLEALGNLHHPLREMSSEKYLMPSLELLQEIQQTGDIFFPQRWLATSFENHSGEVAAVAASKFLTSKQDYPAYLKLKILQAADLSRRAYALKGKNDKL